MIMRKILFWLGGAILVAYPGFAMGQNCHSGSPHVPTLDSLYDIWYDILASVAVAHTPPHNTITRSYKATGKIHFLESCSGDKLCKTGSYLIAGDYFLAVPQQGGYYCAVYMPDSEKLPKIVGLIKNENFIETLEDDYKALKGVWQSKAHGIKKTIGFYKFRGDTFISMKGDATYLDERKTITDPIPLRNFYRIIVLKTGENSFISTDSNLKLQAGKLKLSTPQCDDVYDFPSNCFPAPDFDFSLSATYTYLAPSTIIGNLFK